MRTLPFKPPQEYNQRNQMDKWQKRAGTHTHIQTYTRNIDTKRGTQRERKRDRKNNKLASDLMRLKFFCGRALMSCFIHLNLKIYVKCEYMLYDIRHVHGDLVFIALLLLVLRYTCVCVYNVDICLCVCVCCSRIFFGLFPCF